ESNCYIDDSDTQEIIESIIAVARQYRNNKILKEEFIKEFSSHYKTLEDNYTLSYISNLMQLEVRSK
ncbi:TPA: hypothetical protein ACIRJY_001848, partial [Streptococcus suis]